jgi:radical SAM protein with 4Fe4S-binding SPASM domain
MKIPNLGDLILMGRMKKWNDMFEEEARAHRLSHLFWETTRACNLRCRHCGSDCTVRKADELTTGEIKEAFRSIAVDFDPRHIMVSVTGGEPLIRKDLFEVMGYVHHLGFQWGLVTNGVLVNEDVVQQCSETGMSTVTVSVDGLQPAHEFLRRGGSYDRAVKALKLFKDAGCFQVVQPTTCVSQYSIEDLPALYELFSRMRMDEWRLITIFPAGRAREDPRFLLEPAQLRYLFDFIAGHRKDGGLRVTYGEEGFLGVEYEGKVRDFLYHCPAGITVGSILCDGSIAACPNLPEEFIQGNIRTDRFKDVWENRYGNMRDLHWKKKGKCADCTWWEYCRGNSMHLWDFGMGAPCMCHIEELNKGKG